MAASSTHCVTAPGRLSFVDESQGCLLFGHGPEITDPWPELDVLLER
jgi:hypothetical protein